MGRSFNANQRGLIQGRQSDSCRGDLGLIVAILMAIMRYLAPVNRDPCDDTTDEFREYTPLDLAGRAGGTFW